MFTAIKATLQDAEEKQFTSHDIKDWLRKLKDVSYELDDIMDECAYEVLRLEYQGVKSGPSDKVQCSCLSSFHPKHVSFRHKIAKKMKRICERLKEINDERTQFHLTPTVEDKTKISGVPEWRQTMSSTTELQVHGRDEEKTRIVESLIGDAADVSHSENLLVYPILGQGGLGKTTLAQLIYKDERVVNHFEPRMWVCVSEDFSWSRMIKAIIKEASGEDCNDSDLEPLRKTLQDLLRAKKYLLVLDDVWDEEPENWQILRSVLDCGAKGSSILVTTRLSKVVQIMGTIMHADELSKLSDNDCWELFKHHAFGPNEEEQVELVDIGKAIVERCGGVPLAAKALGSLLRHERSEEAWLNVKASNIWSLKDNIMPALRLSYMKLPVKLRPCFAFCAIFPKDQIIEKQYLIELWMANGFISSGGRLDAEDVGDSVWNELSSRSLFEDIEKDEFGKAKSFKMHDLVHDLAQSVAEDVCCMTSDNDVTALSERIHHLSDHSWKPRSIQLRQVKSLRTYVHNSNVVQVSPHMLECYYSLRVLDVVRSEKLTSSIGDLKHLRYLNLSCGTFKTLPESICKLWNLQILKLDHCHELQKLPHSLIRLKALQQLSLENCWKLSSLPAQIGQLTSLRILSKYIVGEERGFFLEELGPLKLKGDFDIEHLEKVKSVKDAEKAYMSSKQLNKLRLSWDEDEDTELEENVEEILDVLQPNIQQLQTLIVLGYEGSNFPQWMSAPCLKYLALTNCKNCLQLPALGKLPSLKELVIRSMNNVKYIYEECDDGEEVFIALESLSHRDMPNLIRLSREDGENMFSRLSRLYIDNCPNFLAEEVLVHGLRSLKRLDIKGCDKFNVSVGFECLTCLEELWISRCREVEGLEEALQHMTSLKVLTLQDLSNLKLLPECFGNLPLLSQLYIDDCPKLRCLPTSLRLSSLEWLFLTCCHAELEKRCEKETGEDWPNITHIPYIEVTQRTPCELFDSVYDLLRRERELEFSKRFNHRHMVSLRRLYLGELGVNQ